VHLRGRWRTAAGHFGRRFVGHGPTTSSSAATKLPCQSPRHHPRRNASALAPTRRNASAGHPPLKAAARCFAGGSSDSGAQPPQKEKEGAFKVILDMLI